VVGALRRRVSGKANAVAEFGYRRVRGHADGSCWTWLERPALRGPKGTRFCVEEDGRVCGYGGLSSFDFETALRPDLHPYGMSTSLRRARDWGWSLLSKPDVDFLSPSQTVASILP